PPRRPGQQWQAPPPWLRPAGASAPGSPSRAPGPGDGAGAASGVAAAGAAATGGLAGSFADRLASGSGAPPVSPAAVSPGRDDWDDEIDGRAPAGSFAPAAAGATAAAATAAAGASMPASGGGAPRPPDGYQGSLSGDPERATIEDVPRGARRREHERIE